MIELKNGSLCFTFPEVHPDAKLYIDFQRTLRIPDDGSSHPLPPGLGKFPLRHVDDFGDSAPPEWIRHGGVMLPMYQSEAMWLNFHSAFISDHGTNYPFAVRIAAGKVDGRGGWPGRAGRSRSDGRSGRAGARACGRGDGRTGARGAGPRADRGYGGGRAAPGPTRAIDLLIVQVYAILAAR